MILVSIRMHTKCWTFENISCFLKVFGVFEKMFVLKMDYEKATKNVLPTQKSFIHFFLPLIMISYH